MGTEARSVRSTSSCYLRACLIAILVASPAMAWGQSEHRGPSRLTLDGFGLSTLDLSAYPDLWYLSAQGNRLRDLDLSGSPRLNRLLLFDNRFDNRSLERLLAEVEGRGQRGGCAGHGHWRVSMERAHLPWGGVGGGTGQCDLKSTVRIGRLEASVRGII